MMRPLFMTSLLPAAPAIAETMVLNTARDSSEAGSALRFDGPAVADLFMAGNRVMVAAPVGGSADLAGRRITAEGAVAGDLFAVGSDIAVTSALAGSGVVLMMTIMGVFLLRVMLAITALAILAGYALGSCVLGIGTLAAFVVPGNLLLVRAPVMP